MVVPISILVYLGAAEEDFLQLARSSVISFPEEILKVRKESLSNVYWLIYPDIIDYICMNGILLLPSADNSIKKFGIFSPEVASSPSLTGTECLTWYYTTPRVMI